MTKERDSVMTRTHTKYFDQDLLDQISRLALAMDEEWESRGRWIDDETRERGDVRISGLFAAIFLCGERT